jgi:hypothetical protein
MNTSNAAPMAHGLSAVIDALARRLGGPGSGELEAADEGWLGWDAWVRVSGDLYDLPPR